MRQEQAVSTAAPVYIVQSVEMDVKVRIDQLSLVSTHTHLHWLEYVIRGPEQGFSEQNWFYQCQHQCHPQ